VPIPYDGTPEGNALGASMDNSRHQMSGMMADASSYDENDAEADAGFVEILIFLLGGLLVLGMISYGSAG
jgi:hypothetical protein